MRRRLALTLIWVAFLLLVVFSIEMYYWGYPHERKLIESDRADAYAPVMKVYGANLVAILGAWFLKSFKRSQAGDHGEKQRFIVALSVTVLFNILVLYFVSQSHWTSQGALDTIAQAMQLAMIFSVLTIPVNAYYFNTKPQSTANE